jgi:hypothetical protein
MREAPDSRMDQGDRNGAAIVQTELKWAAEREARSSTLLQHTTQLTLTRLIVVHNGLAG